MRKIWIGCVAALTLAACGDPLQNVPRLDDVPVDATAGVAEALPGETETSSTPIVSDVTPAADGAAPRRGLLGFLRGRAEEARASGESDPLPLVPEAGNALANEVGEASNADVSLSAGEATGTVTPQDGDAVRPTVEAAAVTDEARPRRGLFGFLRAGNGPETPATTVESGAPTAVANTTEQANNPDATETPTQSEGVQVAALAPETVPTKERRGLFGRRTVPTVADDGAEAQPSVALGAALPYGEVARVCDAAPRDLGKKVESYPARGKGYTLYDSAPDSTSLRPFYLTGFKDNCVRQFSAALVLFGDPETWEQIHYGAAGSVQPTSETDKAYEKVKARVCKVRAGRPCGGQMKTLAKTTVFVSVYEKFEDNPRWKNILLHDGDVIAVDIKN